MKRLLLLVLVACGTNTPGDIENSVVMRGRIPVPDAGEIAAGGSGGVVEAAGGAGGVMAGGAGGTATGGTPACVPATETCNGRDDDCNGAVDNDATGFYGVCPVYTMWFGGHAYLLSSRNQIGSGRDGVVTGAAAQEACRSYGYELARVETAVESAWLRKQFGLIIPVSVAWIDISQATYFDWQPGAPSGAACVWLTPDGWADRSCSMLAAFLCESR